MDTLRRNRIDFNQAYSDNWWAMGSALSRFFSFSEKYHAFTAIRAAGPVCRSAVLVDIGFGAGYLLRKVALTQGGLRVGLDISLKNIRRFRKEHPGSGIAAVPISPYETRLPIETGSIDLVFCCHVIEHVADDGELVAEAARMLKPGGRAVFLAPINEERLDVPTHLRKYTPEQLRQVLSARFSIVDAGTNDGFSGWIRFLGVNRSPLNNILKKLLIAALSLVPLPVIPGVDALLLRLGVTPSQAWFVAEKK